MAAVSVSFRVQGGQRVDRYIKSVESGEELARLRHRILTAFVAQFPMGQMRSAAPRGSTGRLQQSLRLRIRGGGCELTGIFYGGFRPNVQKIEAAFFTLARQTLQRLQL